MNFLLLGGVLRATPDQLQGGSADGHQKPNKIAARFRGPTRKSPIKALKEIHIKKEAAK